MHIVYLSKVRVKKLTYPLPYVSANTGYFVMRARQIVLGTCRKAKGLGTKRRLVEEEESFMYIPLLETLQTLLKDDTVLTEVKYTCA